ncbi:GNAT family N-acetyltransferase [Halobacillus andaensis]|uniref:GNAT family N-acetyltransferase n=1 Tax=Halobacillus andaensis TaxID=1176239 RepID=UPI003D710138
MEGRGEFSDYIYKKLAECKREYTSYCAKNKEALQPINMMVSNENHKWMGGISSELYWNWLEINDCWVYEQYRGQGIGTELLRTVENMARKKRRRLCYAYHLRTADKKILRGKWLQSGRRNQRLFTRNKLLHFKENSIDCLERRLFFELRRRTS